MQYAIDLALQAEHQTAPNPMVGSVLVSRDGEILSQGWHEKAGGPHAEVNALLAFDVVPPDSTLYVTLEPCNHQGRTGACTDLLLRKQVKKLVVGTLDPNPQMSGQSVAALRRAGLVVKTGVLQDRCYAINRVFNKHITTQLPYITAKAAITLDGKIATTTGESQWITGPEARAFGHQLRSEHQAIAIGRGTLVADNPRLTNRNSGEHRQPDQVLFSNHLAWQGEFNFLQPKTGRHFLVTGSQAAPDKIEAFCAAGGQLIQSTEAEVTVVWALEKLYEQGITSLLLEGGSGLFASFLRENLIDRMCLFIAPRVMSQPEAPGFAGDIGGRALADIPGFRFGPVRPLGADLLIELFLRESDVYRVD